MFGGLMKFLLGIGETLIDITNLMLQLGLTDIQFDTSGFSEKLKYWDDFVNDPTGSKAKEKADAIAEEEKMKNPEYAAKSDKRKRLEEIYSESQETATQILAAMKQSITTNLIVENNTGNDSLTFRATNPRFESDSVQTISNY
jgi:hypothetical protein